MVDRTRSAIIALAGLLVLGCDRGETETLEAVSSEWAGEAAADAPPHMFVIWRFRTEDCLGCSLPARDIRHILNGYGDRVPFIAMHVGSDPDSLLVTNFLRTKRLNARFVHLTEREHETLFGNEIPSVTLVARGEVIWDSKLNADPTAPPPLLDSIVAAVMDSVVF